MLLSRDGQGVESIPLRLMVVAVVATLSVVPASEALESLRNKDFVRRAETQLDLIATFAEVLCVQGPGSARSLSLDFSSDGSLRFCRLVLGDSREGPGACSVLLELSSGARMVSSADEPPVRLCSPEGTKLVVERPVFEMTLRSSLWNGEPVVVAEVV